MVLVSLSTYRLAPVVAFNLQSKWVNLLMTLKRHHNIIGSQVRHSTVELSMSSPDYDPTSR